MTSSIPVLGPDEVLKFNGAMQCYGVFLAAKFETLIVTHVSSNTAGLIGREPAAILGQPLSDVLGGNALVAALHELSGVSVAISITTVVVGGREFDAIIDRSGTNLFAELEPRSVTENSALIPPRNAMHAMAAAESAEELWARAAFGVREVTGYDRVNLSFFHPDGHGEVVGAAQSDDMESHLGLHFPASNIPDEPSGHYATRPSRLVANSLATNADVLAGLHTPGVADLDLSAAILAAPSDRDLQLLDGLGHVSTFSLAIVRNGELVGFITCANRTERRLAYRLRDSLELMANQLSLQLGAMDEIQRLRKRDVVRETRTALVRQLAGAADIPAALLHGDLTLLNLIAADGAAVRLGGMLESTGAVPDQLTLDHLTEVVAEAGGSTDFSSDALPVEFPAVASRLPGVAGLLMRQVGSNGDYLAWFRQESAFTLGWIRDLSAHNDQLDTSAPVSLRAGHPDSVGTSAPWADVEAEASELSRAVESALLNRARSELADLALRDPLTGLPNRRALIDTLNARIASESRTGTLGLLFVDIDHFKSINDSYGHAAGDQALIHVAQVLRGAARESDMIARLGGDEFVVLVDRVNQRKVDRIAARIIQALRAAPTDGSDWRVTASVGVTVAQAGQDTSDFLNAADAAMFRAKSAGRNRSSL
jgi:chemotaxis family two-component system sensor kinase Cph1